MEKSTEYSFYKEKKKTIVKENPVLYLEALKEKYCDAEKFSGSLRISAKVLLKLVSILAGNFENYSSKNESGEHQVGIREVNGTSVLILNWFLEAR